MQNVEPTIIRKRGRPPKDIRITDDKKYFTDYYHRTNRNIICECGLEISIKRRSAHYRTRVHNQLMNNVVRVHLTPEDEKIEILEELPELEIHADEKEFSEKSLNE